MSRFTSHFGVAAMHYLGWRVSASLLIVLAFTGFAIENSAVAQNFSLDRGKIKPVPIESGVVKITPENSLIEFIGTHVGSEPKPRLGGFETFQGEIGIADNLPKSLNVDINI